MESSLTLSISEELAALAKQRPIFHSEADFQHALAWEVHKRLPRASVRLERPVKLSGLNNPIHVDIWVEQEDKALAIELRYRTRALQTLVADETFVLLNQSAQDVSRYDFIKDIPRVERIVADRTSYATGYVVLLTNDPSYWTQSRSSHTVDTDFRLHEGRSLYGALNWGAHASEGTKAGGNNHFNLPERTLCDGKTTRSQPRK